jgi:NitT/TauT family transport system permease protein
MAPVRRSRMALLAWAPPLVVFAAFIGVWYVIVYGFLDKDRRFLLPPPHRVVKVGLLDWDNLYPILGGLLATTKVAFIGLGISILLGVLFAVLMSQGRWIERSFFPYAVALQTIPILALVPLIGLWFGFDLKSRVLVCVMISLFPIINNTLFGLQLADRGLHDLFTLHGAGRLTRLCKLQLPCALPAIFAGFRIAAGLSVIGAIVGDLFFKQGEPGIGVLLENYRARLQTEQLITATLFGSLLGIGVFWLFGYIGARATRDWYEAAKGS